MKEYLLQRLVDLATQPPESWPAAEVERVKTLESSYLLKAPDGFRVIFRREDDGHLTVRHIFLQELIDRTDRQLLRQEARTRTGAMKEFLHIQFDHGHCRQELAALRDLLAAKKELEENADIKPFFEAHPQLAVFLGSYAWSIARFGLLAHQYQLFGDYSCDLVVGDPVRRSFVFVEWEDPAPGCLFRRQGQKATPEWSPRFEHGFSQIVDWFCKLDDMTRTDEFEARFGARHIQYTGLVVAGRDEELTHPRERRRWDWRSQKVLVNGLPVLCATYDQVYQFLSERIAGFFPQETAQA
jgi:hypothetical protein